MPLPQAHALLRQAAKAEYTANHIDEPAASYTVSFVDLASTTEYADLAELETVLLGDTVTVQHADLGVSLSARVVGYKYDPLRQAYVSVELGSVAAKFTSITHHIASAVTAAREAQDLAGMALTSANGKTTNHYGPIQPAAARLGDTWFKNTGEHVEIWIYQKTDAGKPEWVSVASDLNHAQVSAELSDARREVQAAHDAARQATNDTKVVQQRVAEHEQKITQARTRADQAYQHAADARSSAHAWFTQLRDEDKNLSSSISMLTSDINVRVKSGKVISQINVSPETILIDGKRIHITGHTSIDNAIIATAMIKDAAITDAKIASLSASKINTGILSAARIAAGSITSDKLTIANGFITTAMIKDVTITNAKIGSLDASTITTGTLISARIGARTITADKLASNAIQVGLAGWNQSIRISPTQIAWYNGSPLEGSITSSGMSFYYGTRFIGRTGQQYKSGNTNVRGISNSLDVQGDYITWSYMKSSSDDAYTTMLTLDPRGKFYGAAGIHLGAELRTHGHDFYTAGNRSIVLQDCTLTGKGTFAGWAGSTNLSKIVFHTYDLMVVTNGSFYNMTRLFDRVNDLMSRMNSLISLLNQGWVKNISDIGGGRINWNYFSNTGLSAMFTNLT